MPELPAGPRALSGIDLARGPEDRLNRFVHELVVSLINLQLHAPESSEVQESCHSLAVELSTLFAAGCVEDPFILEIGEACLKHRGEPLVSPSLQAGQLLRLCHERGIAALSLGSQADAAEISRALRLLSAREHSQDFNPQALGPLRARFGLRGIDFLLRDHCPLPGAESRDAAMAQYQSMAECLQHSHVAAFHGEELEIGAACSIVEAALKQLDNPQGLLALATRDYVDSFTVGHSVRVALLALQVANHGGAARQDLIRVGTAALLHDIGKSRVPQEILFKNGALDEEEWRLMRQHPRLGGEILLEQKQLDPCCIGAAFCHHMSPQGGYPEPKIPFAPSGISKLVRVCDVFEALTSVRPYKRALSPVEAYTVMLRKPGDFDQDWLQFFIAAMGVFPLGSYLELDTGELGLVVGHGPNPAQPELEILGEGAPTDRDGQALRVVLGEAHEGLVRKLGAPAWEQSSHTAGLEELQAQAADETLEPPRTCCGEDLGSDSPPHLH